MRAEGHPAPVYSQQDHPGIKSAAQLAKRYRCWLLVGSVAVRDDTRQADDGKVHNRSILFNSQGEIAAHYDKIHLFDVDVGDGQTYRESAKILPGNKLAVAELPW